MEYETVAVQHVDYGRNKFLEVTRKRIPSESSEFINIAKGYYTTNGERRYQRGIGFPIEDALIEELIEKLRVISKEDSAEASEE